MTRDIYKLLSAINRAARFPDNFTADEREAMVDLLLVCMEMPNTRLQIRAVEAVITMEGVNIGQQRHLASKADAAVSL